MLKCLYVKGIYFLETIFLRNVFTNPFIINCRISLQVRITGSSVRRQLFEAEQGVCQLCGLDAHALFQSVKALPKRERRAFLETSAYSSLRPQTLNRMITDPKEGLASIEYLDKC